MFAFSSGQLPSWPGSGDGSTLCVLRIRVALRSWRNMTQRLDSHSMHPTAPYKLRNVLFYTPHLCAPSAVTAAPSFASCHMVHETIPPQRETLVLLTRRARRAVKWSTSAHTVHNSHWTPPARSLKILSGFLTLTLVQQQYQLDA